MRVKLDAPSQLWWFRCNDVPIRMLPRGRLFQLGKESEARQKRPAWPTLLQSTLDSLHNIISWTKTWRDQLYDQNLTTSPSSDGWCVCEWASDQGTWRAWQQQTMLDCVRWGHADTFTMRQTGVRGSLIILWVFDFSQVSLQLGLFGVEEFTEATRSL